MVTGEDFGLTAVTAHLFMTMKSNLKMHGDRHRMVSNKIQELSDSDLTYLETLLGREFVTINERKQQFKTKNGWCPEEANSKKLLRLMNAIRSQKKLLTMDKW